MSDKNLNALTSKDPLKKDQFAIKDGAEFELVPGTIKVKMKEDGTITISADFKTKIANVCDGEVNPNPTGIWGVFQKKDPNNNFQDGTPKLVLQTDTNPPQVLLTSNTIRLLTNGKKRENGETAI